MKWITTAQLDAWGRTRTSETELPGMISDLVRATAPDITAIRFPTGEKGQVRGFDGVLDSSVEVLNVPQGRSYWEFGTEAGHQAKALKDFKKRTDQVSATDQAEATLVLVTPFTWDSSDSKNKIEDWEKARKKESEWKKVKLIDGAQLEDWLAECPAVSAWHAKNTLRVAPREGVRSTDDYWFDFADRFDPRLIEEMLLAERERQVDELLTGLMGPPQPLRFIADSPDEVTAFAVAAIRSAKPEVKLFLEARTLVVDTSDAARELAGKSNLVFLVRGEAARAPGQLGDTGPTLVPLGRQQAVKKGTLLERPSSFAMANALAKMNQPQARAEALAKGCGRSLTALARQIPGGTCEVPDWVEHAQLLLPAILAGGWDSTNPLDQAVVTTLAGASSYTNYESRIRGFVEGSDPALDREGTVYKVRAPMDAFVHAGHHIGREHLALLRPVLEQVFSVLDPDPDPDESFRFGAERVPRYSDWLRDGLANTLLLIALWQDTARLDLTPGEGQAFADKAIGELPGLKTNARLLTSLKNELPILAEAAPDVFLSALEHMLEGEGAAIRPIFDEVYGLSFRTSRHTGVLWALETLAWDSRRLRRVALILARLAEIDPGGRLANRPDASLADIFLPWHPGTHAPADARLSVVDDIIASHPQVGWKLLLRLLPDEMRITSGTARPRLRESDVPAPAVTHHDLALAYDALITRAIAAAAGDPARMQELLRPMMRFAPQQRAAALRALDDTLASATGEVREQLWTGLRSTLRQHERFPDADWSLPTVELAEVRRIVGAYAPADPVVSVAELFDVRALERDDAAAAAERARVVEKLYLEQGSEAVLALAGTARMWHLVVRAIEDSGLDTAQVETLLRKSFAAEPGGSLATALASVYRRRTDEAAALLLVKELHCASGNDDATAALLFAWPDEQETWQALPKIGTGVEDSYWRHVKPFWIEGSPPLLVERVTRLLEYGRAIAGLESALNRLVDIPTDLLFRLLDAIVDEINSGTAQSMVAGMLDYDLEQAFRALDARDADALEIGKREYALLPLLERQERPLRLHGLMLADPELFHSIVRDVYRGDNDPPPDEAKLDPAERGRWRQAYRLLSSLDRTPGFLSDSPDHGVLTAWIDRVRELGRQHERAEVTDVVIGQVLAHAPQDDADGAWPHRFVRNEIERAASDELERGIQTERFNMRGVTTRGMYDGGDQERVLADEYQGHARASHRWPRTADMLERMAAGWARDAERQDLEARQRRLRS
ncbi:MAG TPA: hypothetical protein VF759_17625 [Allosphingosinicella sp.]